ncbi:MAG: hypothetical protein IT365_25485, partial [Candidatus Hydrogenedentes bacterium]|nr:hypothetical protein [Candidatus Hydrogenedentota bacterium]
METRVRLWAGGLVVAALAWAAWAQDPPPEPPPAASQGVTVEQIEQLKKQVYELT